VIFTVLPACARFFDPQERRQLTLLIFGVATKVTPPPPVPDDCAIAAGAAPSAASTSAHALRLANERLSRKIPLASLLVSGLRG
jgi:hypothetical protein